MGWRWKFWGVLERPGWSRGMRRPEFMALGMDNVFYERDEIPLQ